MTQHSHFCFSQAAARVRRACSSPHQTNQRHAPTKRALECSFGIRGDLQSECRHACGTCRRCAAREYTSDVSARAAFCQVIAFHVTLSMKIFASYMHYSKAHADIPLNTEILLHQNESSVDPFFTTEWSAVY